MIPDKHSNSYTAKRRYIYSTMVWTMMAMILCFGGSPAYSQLYMQVEVEPDGLPPVTFVPISVDDIFIIVPVASPDLPADPGAEGDSTLEGVDSDYDGVRDDVERHIAFKYSNDRQTREALYLYAKAMQAFLTAKNTTTAQRIMNAIGCIYESKTNIVNASEVALDIKATYLNTLERTQVYLVANRQISGQVFPVSKSNCTLTGQ